MRKLSQFKILVLLLPLLGSILPSPFSSSLQASTATRKDFGIGGTWDFGPGFRSDDLDFSIAGRHEFPNEWVEAKWKEVQTAEVWTKGTLRGWDHAYARINASWGWVMTGENAVSRFAGDDHTLEYSHFNSRTLNGNTQNLSGGIGINFTPWDLGVEVAPIIGYAFDQMHFRSQKADQTLAPFEFQLGGIPGYRSFYSSRWRGPWAGIDLFAKFACRWRVEGGVEYHWIDFRGRGLWKIKDPLNSGRAFRNAFSQSATGWGLLGYLGISYTLSDDWGFGIYANYGRFKTRAGRQDSDLKHSFDTLDPTRHIVGTFPIVRGVKLNPVHWDTMNVVFEFDASW